MFMKKIKESGVRPAISLAVANGDAELAHSALDLLWKFPEHRNWFKFKFPIMVLTKAFYLFPMYIEFMKRKPKEDKEAYRKFLTLLTVCRKDDRVEKTYRIVTRSRKPNEYKNKLVSNSRYYLNLPSGVEAFGNDAAVSCMVVDDIYNRSIAREICKLINRGGTYADQQKFSIGILALALEGMPHEKILDQVKTEMKRVLEKPQKFKTKILKKPLLKKCKNVKKNKSN